MALAGAELLIYLLDLVLFIMLLLVVHFYVFISTTCMIEKPNDAINF